MIYYFSLALFVFSIFIFKLYINIAIKNDFTDKPSNLSSHTTVTPTSGGLVMFIIFISSMLYFVYFSNYINNQLPNKLYLFFICFTVFSLFAFYDDINIHQFID